MSRNASVAAFFIGIALAVVASPASAQGSVAEELFIEGKALVQNGDYPHACVKFKASHDLDPTATGTLLNLALCHEQIGKPATAWAEFRQVTAESQNRREDRVAMAREHEAKLAPLLSHVTLVVPAAARAPGLRIKLDDGAPISEAGWGTPVPVDPGEHVLEVSAPAKVTGRQSFTVAAAASSSQLVIVPLADAHEEPTVLAPAPDRTRRNIGIMLGGAGLVAVGIGAIFGLDAVNKNSDAKGLCASDGVCDSEATRDRARGSLSDAHTAANVANVAIGGGVLLAAAGVILVLTAPRSATKATDRERAWHAAPLLVSSGGGVGLLGAW